MEGLTGEKGKVETRMTWWMYIISYLLWTMAAVPLVLRRWMAWPVCSKCGRDEGSDKHLEKCNRYSSGYAKKFEFKPRGALFARSDRDARYVLGLSALWPFLLSYVIGHYTMTREWRGTRTLVLASVRPSPVELERIIREQAAEIEKRTDELKPLRSKESSIVIHNGWWEND